jgi:hypothetical protein
MAPKMKNLLKCLRMEARSEKRVAAYWVEPSGRLDAPNFVKALQDTFQGGGICLSVRDARRDEIGVDSSSLATV